MATKNEIAAQIMEHLCDHEWHGYSQPGRWGDGEGYCDIVVDGVTYRVAQGDRDCATAVLSSLKAAGIDTGCASWTGDMRACLVATGNYEWMPMSYTAQRGDIYLNEFGAGMGVGCNGHTAMCTSAVPDMLAEFSGSETGGIDGQVGDQTGWESHIRDYYNCPWDGILRYTGKADRGGAPAPQPHQVSGNPVNDAGFAYRAHVQGLGWLDPVRDGQTAGTTGYGLRLEAIKITPPEGMVLDAKCHIQDVGWTRYDGIKRGASSGTGSSDNDPVIGTAGKSLRAEALELDVVSNATGKTLCYRVHLADVGWTGWVEEGYAAGTVGIGKQIEAVQFKLV